MYLNLPAKRYIMSNHGRRFCIDVYNQLPIVGGDAITLTLLHNMSIHQQELYMKFETIFQW